MSANRNKSFFVVDFDGTATDFSAGKPLISTYTRKEMRK